MRLAVFACVLLTGCAAGWYKPGAQQQDFYAARGQCNAQAAAAFPPVMTGTNYQAPTKTTCQPGLGNTVNCTTQQGQQYQWAQTDQNMNARTMAFGDCMRANGWIWRTQ